MYETPRVAGIPIPYRAPRLRMASGTAWQELGRQRAIISAFAIVEPSIAPLAIKNAAPIEELAAERGGFAIVGEVVGEEDDSCADCISATALGASGRDGSAVATCSDSTAGAFGEFNAMATSRVPEYARIEENAWAGAIWAAASVVPHTASVNNHKPAFATCCFICRKSPPIFPQILKPTTPCSSRMLPVRQLRRALQRSSESGQC
ncbi:hypothetical protein SBA2_260103 [Acidobacteriia bacterium SbA2]|nr:hypothetical protein SBA2_260103 [Acidobacteriia bacterium SbA2]